MPACLRFLKSYPIDSITTTINESGGIIVDEHSFVPRLGSIHEFENMQTVSKDRRYVDITLVANESKIQVLKNVDSLTFGLVGDVASEQLLDSDLPDNPMPTEIIPKTTPNPCGCK